QILPVNGDTFPYFDGTGWGAVSFLANPTDGTGYPCAVPNAIGSYDVFGTGTGHIATGPAWPDSSLASRGLTYRSGRRIGVMGTYLGSINVSAAGQVTCNIDYGLNRKWEVWNAHNQVPVILKAGDPAFVWSPQFQPAWGPYLGNANTRNSVFTGLP